MNLLVALLQCLWMLCGLNLMTWPFTILNMNNVEYFGVSCNRCLAVSVALVEFVAGMAADCMYAVQLAVRLLPHRMCHMLFLLKPKAARVGPNCHTHAEHARITSPTTALAGRCGTGMDDEASMHAPELLRSDADAVPLVEHLSSFVSNAVILQ